ncbi:hypothetical protein N665_0252s0008 [Sinapis alba]|nr:hypothetical protein N665_0252s0008 [Sinapis alba]
MENQPGIIPPEGRSVSLGDGKGESKEGKQEGGIISSRENKSWVSAAQDKKSLKKYEAEVSTKGGKHMVAIPDEVLTDSTPLWDDFVVGKFMDLAPHMAKVHKVVKKIWSYGELASKVDMVSNPKAREKILKRGMWNITEVPMEEKQEENAIPMWVHLKKVPLHMYSWEGLSFMTSTVGFPDRLHPETIACSNLEVAKVFVNIDVSKTLPKEIVFSHEGKEFTEVENNKKGEEVAGSQKESVVANWSIVSPAKVGRSKSSQGHEAEIQISASKYYVLSMAELEEAEEGEILVESQESNEDERLEISGQVKEIEGDQLEDDILAQQAKLKEWIVNKDMKFGCILETKVKERKADIIMKEVFREWSTMINYECSQGGRIWVLWRDSVRMTPVYKSDQLITCSVGSEEEEEFYCSFIYASNQIEGRKELWEDLCHHHNSPTFKNKEWMIMGDFNEILDGEENSRFSSLESLPRGMRDFQRMVLQCQMSDMGTQGPLFTWSNKQEEGIICKKLDRLLPPREKIRRPFKYVNAIGNLPSFLPKMNEYWDTTETLFHSTSVMYRFSKKLKNLKPIIRELGRDKLGNLTKRAKEAHCLLCEKQKSTLSNPCESAVREEAEAYEKWLHVASLEEEFLKQHAKLHWLEVGDQNNKTYHNAVRTRQAQNMI